MYRFFVAFFLLLFTSAWAQYENIVSNYTQNLVTINPAFAGMKKKLVVSALYNKQFSGFESYVTQQNVSLHAPVNHYRVGLGAYVYSVKQSYAQLSVYAGCASYKVKIFKGYLSAGLGAGMYQLNADVLSLSIQDLSDPTLAGAVYQKSALDFSTGFLYSDAFTTIGISALHLVPRLDKNTSLHLNAQHHLIAARRMKISKRSSLMPASLLRYTLQNPLTADASLFYLYQEMVRAGFSYRTTGVVSIQASLNLKALVPSLAHTFFISYAFDYNVRSLHRYVQSCHEVMVIGEFSVLKKPEKSKPVLSPLLF